MLVAQTAMLKPGLMCKQLRSPRSYFTEPLKHEVAGQSRIKKPAVYYKSTDAVSVIDLGTSADAYSMGVWTLKCEPNYPYRLVTDAYSMGVWTLSNLVVNNDIHAISFIHRMGGILDPEGYNGDMGYDISLDGGMRTNWLCGGFDGHWQ